METCNALINILQPDYMKVPCTESEWKTIADDFNTNWQFPHCIGAFDGKHISITMPPNSGSLYYNYKKKFSVVLLALVDANYKFIYVDVGCYGRISDGGVYNQSKLSEILENNTLSIPSEENLSSIGDIPYVVVADDAFALKTNIMKPYGNRNLTYEQSIFNYRLSRARRVVENAFGILSQRFRIFTHAIPLTPSKLDLLIRKPGNLIEK